MIKWQLDFVSVIEKKQFAFNWALRGGGGGGEREIHRKKYTERRKHTDTQRQTHTQNQSEIHREIHRAEIHRDRGTEKDT